MKGEIAATCMMEPWISYAEKASCKVLAEARYRGAEVVTWETRPETVRSFSRALGRAVDLFNADPWTYVPLILADLPADVGYIDATEFKLGRLQYLPVRPYPKHEFERTYEWMLRWDLIDPGLRYEDVVDNTALLSEREEGRNP